MITDPQSGEILANAIYQHDIEEFSKYPSQSQKYRCNDTYEPGSTQVTAATQSMKEWLPQHWVFDPVISYLAGMFDVGIGVVMGPRPCPNDAEFLQPFLCQIGS